MRRRVIAGNWKMYKTVPEALELVRGLRGLVEDVDDVDIVVCPPFTALQAVGGEIEGSNIALGAQDIFWEEEGAYTGEVAPRMLVDVGCEYVIIGHSERRSYFGETNETVNKKIKAALKHNLTPIVCCGERLEEREAGKSEAVVEEHIRGAFAELSREDAEKIIIAYEPVWAIGTGKTATPELAAQMHAFIRSVLASLYDKELAEGMRILYGGSVKPENIDGLMAEEELDGALVGGASLKAESFARIVKFRR